MATLSSGLVLGSGIAFYVFNLCTIIVVAYYFMARSKIVFIGVLPIMLVLITLLAISVGGINVMLGRNDFREFIVYSILGSSQVLAFFVGYSTYLKIVNNRRLFFELLYFVGSLELFQFFTRVVTVGLLQRSSLGFTFLLPFVVDKFSTAKSIKGLSILAGLLVFYLIVIGVSGLRSVLILGFLIWLSALYYLFSAQAKTTSKIKRLRKRNFLKILLIGSVGIGIGIVSFGEVFKRPIEIVSVRLSQTFFHADGVRLDPKGGRLEEAQQAIEQFEEEAVDSSIDYLIGRGYGFTFYEYNLLGETASDAEKTAHVHLTGGAYFVRSGFIGALFYASLLLWCLKLAIIGIVRKDIRVLCFVTFLFGFSSSFAGLIVGPSFWLLAGGAYRSLLANKFSRNIEIRSP